MPSFCLPINIPTSTEVKPCPVRAKFQPQPEPNECQHQLQVCGTNITLHSRAHMQLRANIVPSIFAYKWLDCATAFTMRTSSLAQKSICQNGGNTYVTAHTQSQKNADFHIKFPETKGHGRISITVSGKLDSKINSRSINLTDCFRLSYVKFTSIRLAL